jgi:3-hydroxybutyryl-CoA dehydrogenase
MPAEISAVVVGTGRMAPGIAAALAQAGARVTVAGRSLDRAIRTAELAGGDVGACALEPAAFRGAQLVVETVTEDAEVKAQVYAQVAPWLGEDALLTTNTSGLSITGLARGLPRPGSFAGLHFLYPADVTPIVEIIGGEATDARTVDALSELAARMGKAPIVAHRDVPGFVWNRLQHALLREALWLVDQQVADVATVDAAVSDGLAPRWLAAGPFATVDLGGSDTWSRVAAGLFPHLASDPGLAAILQQRSDDGATFYEWDPDALSDVSRLRSDAIAASRDLAAQRRQLTPAARPGGPGRKQAPDQARTQPQPQPQPGDGAAAWEAAARAAEDPAGPGRWPPARRAALLRAVAGALDADEAERAAAGGGEAPLSMQRMPGEIARASDQLRLLAVLYENGPAQPVPEPRADPSA